MPLRLFRSRNVAGANAIQALLVAGMFGMFFLGALYLQRILGYDALEVGLAFLPATIVMGTLSLGFSEKLIMRFGPRTTLIPGVVADRRRPAALRPHAGRRQLPDRPAAADAADRRRRRHLLPVADDAGDVGRRRPSDAGPRLGRSSTPACRWAARSASPCWRRSPASAPTTCSPTAPRQRAALNSGYHLAYLIGAALVAAALVVAVTVLREPSPAEMAEMAGGAEEEHDAPRQSRPTRPDRQKRRDHGTAGCSLRGHRK